MTTTYQEIREAIDARRHELAEKVVARQYAQQPEVWRPYGDVGREKSVRDVKYHLGYLVEALAASDPALFVEYAAWVKTLFAGLDFPDSVLTKTLACMREVLQEELPEELTARAVAYLDAAIESVGEAPAVPESFIRPGAPLAELADTYLGALLRGERHVAHGLILNAVEGDEEVRDLYLHVFQPAQREIGRLWQTNQISVAQEHYCTAATQLIMSQLYPRIFTTEKTGRRLVATCVGDELHEIGVRMVADFFEMEGWDTYYLGANTPTTSVLQTLAERRPDLLGISTTITYHVGGVADLIERVRASEAGRDVKILVGGYAFNVAPELWRQVGADGCARDAEEAVAVGNRLLQTGGVHAG